MMAHSGCFGLFGFVWSGQARVLYGVLYILEAMWIVDGAVSC